MFRVWFMAMAALLGAPSTVRADNVAVEIDLSAAKAVLNAVGNRDLTTEQALEVAELPGNQGLIRKAQSYGLTADDALFAQALVAAAHHDAGYQDKSKFRFRRCARSCDTDFAGTRRVQQS